MHVLANDAMRFFGGERDVARHLRVVMGDAAGAETKGRGIDIAGLALEARPVDGTAVEAWRRAGFEAASAQAEVLERFAEQNGGGFSRASGRILLFAAMNEAVEKGSGGDDDGFGGDATAVAEEDAGDTVASCRLPVVSRARCNWQVTAGGWQLLHDHIRHLGLLDAEVRLRFEDLAHLQAIGLLVALGAGRPDGGAAGSVEQAKLDSDGVGDFAHDAAERVDFADEMALGDAANGGVARHLGDQVDIQREERRLQAQASGCHGGFASGMTGSDHDNVEMFVKFLHVHCSEAHVNGGRLLLDCNNVGGCGGADEGGL